MKVYCAMKGCQNRANAVGEVGSGGYILLPFPEDPGVFAEWLERCGRESVEGTLAICSKHFMSPHRSCLDNTTQKEELVPTLFLEPVDDPSQTWWKLVVHRPQDIIIEEDDQLNSTPEPLNGSGESLSLCTNNDNGTVVDIPQSGTSMDLESPILSGNETKNKQQDTTNFGDNTTWSADMELTGVNSTRTQTGSAEFSFGNISGIPSSTMNTGALNESHGKCKERQVFKRPCTQHLPVRHPINPGGSWSLSQPEFKRRKVIPKKYKSHPREMQTKEPPGGTTQKYECPVCRKIYTRPGPFKAHRFIQHGLP